MSRQSAKRLVPIAVAFAAATAYACTCPNGDLGVAAIKCTPTAVKDSAHRIALSCIVTVAARGSSSNTASDTIYDPNQ
jgi:hypothetical protein